jgi:hypothetical protein
MVLPTADNRVAPIAAKGRERLTEEGSYHIAESTRAN